MMRRFSLGLIVVLTCAFAALGVRSAHADGAMASVSPGDGDMRTAFTFSVTGMTPGHAVLIALYDNNGNRYTYQKDSVDQAIVVDDSGAASVQVTPGTDLPGSVAGAWRATFTEEETGYNATVPFSVAL